MQRESSAVSESLSDQTLELDETPRPDHGQNGDADVGVTSDEENDILREIKEEIKRKVREDIKEELAKYDLKNLSSRTESVASSRVGGDAGGAGDLLGMENLLPERDVKYQEAYQKMVKLDKILRKKMAREREVKRDRAMLEKRIKDELEQLRNAATSRRCNDELNNTMKFLALTPAGDAAARREADAGLNDEYTDPHTPVFPTEYLFEDATGVGAEGAAGSGTARSSADFSPGGGGARQRREHPGKAARAQQKPRKMAGGSADPSKDFIKRNIELAAASNDAIPMTPEERERLDALLRDLDSIPELPEEFLDSGNAYQLALAPGEGYRMTSDESRRLHEIETRLALMGSAPHPASTHSMPSGRSEAGGGATSRLQSELLDGSSAGLSAGYRVTALQRMQAGLDWDLDQLGEKALAEVREERLMSHRLEDINSRLELLGNESSQDPLSADQMSSLLSDCVRSIGQSKQGTHRGLHSAADAADTNATPSVNGDADGAEISDVDGDSSSRLEDSGRDLATGDSQLMQVPPLDRTVLDRLLAEARAAGIGQNWIRPEPIAEEEEEEGDAERSGFLGGGDSSDDDDGDEGERLVLPDISLYTHMSAPKTPNSGRYSAS